MKRNVLFQVTDRLLIYLITISDVFRFLCLEYFKLNGYYNVICVDWSLIVLDSTYLAARWRCKEIGNYVAELIAALLDKTNLKLDSVHIIGFSMGAHIAGYAGKNFNGQIPRITGTDQIHGIVSINTYTF